MANIPRSKSLHIYSDGASRGNPGLSAFSVIFFDEDGTEYYKYSEYLGRKTSNQAEMLAIKHGLDKAIEYTRWKVVVFSDSENSICWLNGEYRIKSKNIRPIFEEIKNLKSNFKEVEFIHVPRANKIISICDKMCNICLDKIEGNE